MYIAADLKLEVNMCYLFVEVIEKECHKRPPPTNFYPGSWSSWSLFAGGLDWSSGTRHWLDTLSNS